MMGCFPCSSNSHKRIGKEMTVHNHSPDRNGRRDSPDKSPACSDKSKSSSSNNNVKEHPKDVNQSSAADELLKDGRKARTFTFEQLMAATEHFNPDNFLGEGGFGPVYRGKLEDGQIVAIKQLDLYGVQGIREFIVEVMTLSLADHPNLVKLIGYCAEGDQRLLVYEYMPFGSLEEHLQGCLHKRKQLDWNTRMKIAAGAAKGLQYLHEKMNPPIIYRDLKCSNILLDEGYKPKLSDFGLAKVGPVGDKTHVSTRVMGTYGYCAPDYAMTGQLTAKADIYSFGVVLLELITGRRAIDPFHPDNGQTLVSWARPLFKDRKNFPLMADPVLRGQYPMRGLYQALAISAMCIQEQASLRPLITDIVTALDFLSTQVHVSQSPSPSSSPGSNSSSSQRLKKDADSESNSDG